MWLSCMKFNLYILCMHNLESFLFHIKFISSVADTEMEEAASLEYSNSQLASQGFKLCGSSSVSCCVK